MTLVLKHNQWWISWGSMELPLSLIQYCCIYVPQQFVGLYIIECLSVGVVSLLVQPQLQSDEFECPSLATELPVAEFENLSVQVGFSTQWTHVEDVPQL